jgi:murein DD-endopeptidase MepM/ murein hydrolase activator NlpD
MEGMKKALIAILSTLLALSFIISCSAPSSYVPKEPAKGIYHRVKKGETFWSIARAYNVKMQDLAEVNNINNPNLIEEGTIVFVPDATQVIDDVVASIKKMDAENNNGKNIKSEVGNTKDSDKKALPPVKATEEATAIDSTPEQKPADEKIERKSKSKSAIEEKENIQFEKKRFIWPVEERTVKTRFGIQPTKPYHNNTWIKIVSVMGSKVKAAASGRVIFSSTLPNFGQTIIIRHADNFATVYEHLKTRYVKPDKIVKKGEVIALLGETDEAGDAFMNFEVRLHGKARNPLFFLP